MKNFDQDSELTLIDFTESQKISGGCVAAFGYDFCGAIASVGAALSSAGSAFMQGLQSGWDAMNI